MNNRETDESKRRYRQLIRTSPAPINLFDASGEILWGNDAVVDLLGLGSRAQLVGRSIFEFIHADDRYTAERELTEVVENETATGPTAMCLQRADGEVCHIRVATAPGRYGGVNIGQAVIINDTPLNEIREELDSERRFFEASLNALQDIFYVINPAGEIERWNETLLDVLEYTETEIDEMDVEDFFVERDIDRISESIETAFVEGTDTVRATALTKYGNEIPFEFRKRRLTINGDTIGLVGIGRDISVRNAREQHLRAVDHIIRHNLRNQLNIIRGETDLIQDSTDAGDSPGVDRIDASVERLISLFDDHKRIVTLLTGWESPRPVNIVPLIKSLAGTLKDDYPKAEITCKFSENPSVSMVPTLETAFLELAENAIEHNDLSTPSVRFVVKRSESQVAIHVVDNGPTIPEMEYEPLMDENRIRPTFHPTGLGLWFVHLAVSYSGGTLRFERNESRGNTVTVELRTPSVQWQG